MFTKILVLSGLAALSAAQSMVLSFTSVPNPVTDGQAQAITYMTNDTSTPVSIILRKGLATDLQTVSTLTTSASGGQFVWTPATSLANGNDYALEITQGSQYNYFGPFQVQGADASAMSGAMPSAYMSSAAMPTAYMSSTVSANGTASTTIPVAPGTVSAATGVPMSRNTTMSIATLTAYATSSSPATSTASTTASTSPSTSTNGASALDTAATFSLFLGAVVAALYW